MGTAHLDVWVTAVGEACRIDERYQWYVHVLHCDGEILDWCRQERYVNIMTTCGHAEIEVPPGCYMVCATWGPAAADNENLTSLGNHISHVAVVRANCDDRVCVTLFVPTFHYCGFWWNVALRDHMDRGVVELEAGEEALAAVERVLSGIEGMEEDPMTTNLRKLTENPEQ